ncbi:MAG: hypothetical protein GXC78_03160 [Chitinophagaceae bacterium]|nr:hypothetical protein [Chitinophagaceae bacterium]
MRRTILILLGNILCGLLATAQEPDLDSVKTELYKVNRVFDSSRYLAFDVVFRMNTDTSFGKFDQDEQAARYILNNKNMYYQMGEDEYVQTDSFTYNIYNADQVIIMTRELPVQLSNRFPLREFLDSIINWYDSAYMIRINQSDTVHSISFVARGDSLPYSRFAIYYQPYSYLPVAIEMETREPFDRSDIPDTLLAKVSIKPVRHTLYMQFMNYSFPDSLDMFNDKNYVIYDRYRRQYKLADKYRDYKLMTNNVVSSRVHPNDELMPVETEPEPID